MDRKIELQQLNATRDALGDEIDGWVTYAHVWAQWVPETGRETLQAGREDLISQSLFRIRWRNDVSTTDRLVYDGQAYTITNIVEIQRRVGLELVCQVVHERV